MKRITHKDVERACARYNQALKLRYFGDKGERPSIGYLMWSDIRGDGTSRRGLYAICNESGGVGSSDLRRRTMRQTIAAIDLAIKFHRLASYAVIIQATHERGETQKAALRELGRRGLWLSDDQKRQAGLTS